MKKDRIQEIVSISLGIMSVCAIIGIIVRSNFDINEILESVINFTQVAVPVIVLLATIQWKRKSIDQSQLTRELMQTIQKKYSDILSGPKYSRDNYDPEKGQGKEYLFIGNLASKQKAKFIPIQPLEEGILVIYIQKGTLVWGLNYSSETATKEEIIRIRTQVNSAIKKIIIDEYSTLCEILPNTNDDWAIMVDFDENKMGQNKLGKAIEEFVECAIQTLNNLKKS